MLYHLTTQCHKNCPHCLLDAKPIGVHADMSVTKAMVSFLNRCQDPALNIGGGEPTEHPDFFNHLEYILRNARCMAFILATNGSFMADDAFVQYLAHISKETGLLVQISALKGLYQDRDETIARFRQYAPLFEDRANLIEEITVIDQIGRAKGKDWSHLSTYKRKGPNCFNMLSIARSGQFNSMQQIISFQAMRGLFCKPMVSPTGQIYAGETPSCVCIGDVLTDSPDDVFNSLKKQKPCESCGVASPVPFYDE